MLFKKEVGVYTENYNKSVNTKYKIADCYSSWCVRHHPVTVTSAVVMQLLIVYDNYT
jgi:hypothetical protein